MSESDASKMLLKESYKLLEEIENDGCIRANNSSYIPLLLARIRSHIYPAIPFDEVPTITFRCPNCKMANLEVTQTAGEWDYITCICEKRYRVIWKRENIETFVLPIDEDAQS